MFKGDFLTNFLIKRAATSAVSLLILVILVFFLVRLTGDPASLFLPLDASEEAKEKFRELNGLNDPYEAKVLLTAHNNDFQKTFQRFSPIISTKVVDPLMKLV